MKYDLNNPKHRAKIYRKAAERVISLPNEVAFDNVFDRCDRVVGEVAPDYKYPELCFSNTAQYDQIRAYSSDSLEERMMMLLFAERLAIDATVKK